MRKIAIAALLVVTGVPAQSQSSSGGEDLGDGNGLYLACAAKNDSSVNSVASPTSWECLMR